MVTPEVSVAPQPRVIWLRWEWLLAVSITAVGFGLRMWAVRWGLPYVDHPDEPALVNVVLRMMRSGDLNPHFFLYPSFYFYLLLAIFTAHHRWGMATGLYPGLDHLSATTDLYTTIPEFFVWGRMLAILLGSLTVLGVFVLGQSAWSRSAGLLAALFLATLPFHMRHSQYVTTDVASAWFVLLAYLGATAMLHTGSWRSYLLAGLWTGLAASTKYNAGAIAIPLIVAHALYWRRQAVARSARLLGAGMVALLSFLAGTPYALLAWPEFRDGLLHQMSHYGAGAHGDYLGAWNVAGYLDFFWHDGLRPAASLALLLGLALLLRRWRLGLLWLSFAVPYLLVFLAQPGHFMRNLMPLVVLCALPVGVGGAAAIDWLGRHMPRYRPLAAVGVVLLLYSYPAKSAVGLTAFQARTDSKVAAAAFVSTLPRGQRIALELNPVAWAGDPIVEPVPFLTQHPLEWYRANSYRYLVANNSWRDQQDTPIYQEFKAGTTLLREFRGDQGGQPGPRIEVLDLGFDPGRLSIVRREALFGANLWLLGYELQPGALRPAISPLEGADQRVLRVGEGLQINLMWQVQQPLPHDYALFVHVLDSAGNVVAQRDALLRQDEYPSSRWLPDEVVVDRADLPLPALTPGSYTVKIGVYRMDSGERLPLAYPEPGSDGSTFVLTTIEVRE
ncbi:MAG TPA: glycosyltransferase family 39 protein [Herpetosiphonaceae bacterium]